VLTVVVVVGLFVVVAAGVCKHVQDCLGSYALLAVAKIA
jgi:hypothetical protein